MAVEIEEEDECGGGDSWLGTFADISLLLLTFFILLVSMSTIETEKFNSTFSSMRDTFGGSAQNENVPSPTPEEIETASMVEFMRMKEELLEAQQLAFDEIKSFITTQGVEGQVSAVFDNGIITLTVPGDVLFAPGSEALSPEAGPALNALLEMFREHRDMTIAIKGYTDDSPIPQNARFKDNWELSALRAVNVLRWYIDAGIPIVRLTATGMGDLNPLFPNTSEENRARNRRVEFELEKKVQGAS